MVSPLDKNCAEFFRYSVLETILPTDDLGKKQEQQQQFLTWTDIDKLRAMRREAIDGVLFAMRD
jgi:hypothetical protein